MDVHILFYNDSIVDVFATESAAGNALALEAAKEQDAVDHLHIAKYEVKAWR